MPGIKSLAKETAVYGLSSIIGRFLNWCLVPLYTYIFAASQYGIVSYLYSFTAVALVILTYGMETGFFRFANKESDPERVYTTALVSVGSTSLLFIALITIFLQPLSGAMLLSGHGSYIWMLGVTVALDAFSCIPFAYLRYRKKAYRFAGLKLLNVGLNIALNLFFLLLCPAIEKSCPGAIDWFYLPFGGEAFGIGWIFFANLLTTVILLLCLIPELTGRRWRCSASLLSRMLSYSWPLLVLGVAGILSQNMGQIMIPYLFEGHPHEAQSMVGLYSANMKIAIVMVMFTQAFRYAYEPFIFAQAREAGEDKKRAYCDAMKYFVVFGFLIFLGVMYYLPVLKHFVAPAYWAGLRVVPIMMLAELCFGVFFNLSLWYKLTDRTRWGMYLSLICFALMFIFNLWFVPAIGIPDGYLGAAWAALASYFAVMLISYFVGRHYYPLPYELGRMGLYALLAGVLWVAGSALALPGLGFSAWFIYTARTLLLLLYIVCVIRTERIPLPGRLARILKQR